MRSVETVVLSAAEIAADDPHILSTQLVFNETTGELRVGPGTWDECKPTTNVPLVKRYVASVVQDGTAAGVPTVLFNSLGDDVVFTYGSSKNTLTLADAFPADKVVVTVEPVRTGGQNVLSDVEFVDEDSLTVGFMGADSASAVNGTDFTITIEVYP